MAVTFRKRTEQDQRRIGLFFGCVRYALAHNRLNPVVVPTRYADVDPIRSLGGHHFVPIIEDDGISGRFAGFAEKPSSPDGCAQQKEDA